MSAIARVSSAVLAVSAAMLAACDPIHGINRRAWLSREPDYACISAAIRSIPEVRSVRCWNEAGGRSLTWTGLKPPDQLHYFAYEVDSGGATLYVRVDHAGRVEMSQHLLAVGKRVPQERLDAIRPIMIRIESALEKLCGIGPLEIEEHGHQ